MTGYFVSLIISTGLFGLFALGLNLQWGFAGLINFGHIVFMTIGAYTTVLLSKSGFLQNLPERMIENFGWMEKTPFVRDTLLKIGSVMPDQINLIIAALIGALLAGFLGLIIGTSTLRLREDYLAIVTIGVSELIRLIALNEGWLTEGSFGVQGYPLPLDFDEPSILGKVIMIGTLSLLGIFALWQLGKNLKPIKNNNQIPHKANLSKIIWAVITTAFIITIYINGVIALSDYTYKAGLMLLILLVLTLVYWGLDVLVHSPWGRVLKAIREDEEIPRALGKNVFWYKLQAFMLGGAIAGIAGSFYAWQLTSIYPTKAFEPLVTFNAWTIVVLGGAGSNPGTLIGATIFWAYDSITRFALPELVKVLDQIFKGMGIATFLDDARLGAFRIMIIGLILMILMICRPQGILGNKDELSLNK
jgi:neutral amino acid transport system permease protein